MKSDATEHPATVDQASRRDFLAGVSALGVSALMPGLPQVAFASRDDQKQAPAGSEIAYAAIYPPIGISRVGNGDEHFFAPEVPGVPHVPKDGYKQNDHRVKKQVQRYRVYGFDKHHRVVREIGPQDGDAICWSVHLANSKGAWYQFNSPMDMGAEGPGLTGQKRNQFFDHAEREDVLVIDGKEKQIEGRCTNHNGDEKDYNLVGEFWEKPNRVSVPLGQLRTDEAGRLLVVPGSGQGGSATPGNAIASFSDNDGWYDDWCDGPVHGTVKVGGREIQAEGAWAVCCGPNWVPEIDAFITLYDVIRDTMIYKKLETLPKMPSFVEYIYPYFLRLGQMSWIAESANLREGWIDVGNFLDPGYIEKLADNSPDNKAFRDSIFRKFRDPQNTKTEQQYRLPYMMGSGVGYDGSPDHWLQMPESVYGLLKKWRNGEFVNDWPSGKQADNAPQSDPETLPVAKQPEAITRAALEACSGGAFHPGVELTWPMRQPAMYRDDRKRPLPYRLREATGDSVQKHVQKQNAFVGRLMSSKTAFFGVDGREKKPLHKSGEAYFYEPDNGAPIGPQMAGDLTRWMGLPWFGDAFSCGLAVEYANDFPNAIWWPALTPIDILPEVYYKNLLREDLTDEQKLRFYENRVPWVRGVRGIGLHVEASYIDGLSRMVDLWKRMGFIVPRKRPENLSADLKKIIPEVLFVEVDRGSMDLMTNAPPNDSIPPVR